MRIPAIIAPLFLACLSAPALGNPATATRHVVEEGETLSGIANRAAVPAVIIAAANGLVAPYVVRVGQTLLIPRQRTHVVKLGETLGAIANRYDVSTANLAIANGLAEPYPIRSGQRLIVPAVMPDPPAAPPPVRDDAPPYFRPPHDGLMLAGFGNDSDAEPLGITIAVERGDMIRAAAAGTVVFAQRELGQFGRLVVLDHGNGWRTRYGHLSRITVKLGDVVGAGERIGLGGMDGTATRPKLHFDILHENVPIDPTRKLSQR